MSDCIYTTGQIFAKDSVVVSLLICDSGISWQYSLVVAACSCIYTYICVLVHASHRALKKSFEKIKRYIKDLKECSCFIEFIKRVEAKRSKCSACLRQRV